MRLWGLYSRPYARGLALLGAVRVVPVRDGVIDALGPLEGTGSFPAVLDYLRGLGSSGPTRWIPAFRREASRGPGWVVFITDGIGEDGWENAFPLDRSARRLLIHLDAREIGSSGRWGGDGLYELIDRETGERLRRFITPDVRAMYNDRLRSRSRNLESHLRRRRAIYRRIPPGMTFDDAALFTLKGLACDTP